MIGCVAVSLFCISVSVTSMRDKLHIMEKSQEVSIVVFAVLNVKDYVCARLCLFEMLRMRLFVYFICVMHAACENSSPNHA